MPSSTTCHSLTTQTTQALLPSESVQTQEAIKVLKTTKGDHDVIEIATKYMPSVSTQETTRREQSSALPSEDIVVDMKYEDAKKDSDSTTSELNIVHAAPQSFETVLVEPDDVTTEVVVDADGTKRIIVRKLRRTMVTSRQTTQQRMSTLSTALGDATPMIQAFSEAAMRDQQVTVTRTKPDGTVETTTRQIYGGKVTTGAPTEGINVEEYESEPHYTRMVTQGQIGDISYQPVEEEILLEGGEYQTRTSSVHAVVQQVTRRVIKKTRRIIRKVTIVDGKETTTEEVIEEPEEIEIDEQDIPHISINVVKNEDQRAVIPTEKSIEGKAGEREARPGTSTEPCIFDSSMQGPFFGPFAKDMVTIRRGKMETKATETPIAIAEKGDGALETFQDIESRVRQSTTLEEPTTELADSKVEASRDSRVESAECERVAQQEMISSPGDLVLQVENLADIRAKTDEGVKEDENLTSKEREETSKYEHERLPTEVNGTSTLIAASRTFIEAERSTILQTPIEEVTTAQTESLKPTSDPAITDDEPVITKPICKSDDAPVKSETPSIELENGTVEVETHHDDSSTVAADKHIDALNVVMLEEGDEKDDKPEVSKRDDASFEQVESKERDIILTSLQQSESSLESVVPSSKADPAELDESTEKITPVSKGTKVPCEEQDTSDLFANEKEDDSKDEAFKPEYKPVFHKVEISLSVRNEDERAEPSVSIKTKAERPEVAPYRIVKEDVDISLPADTEKIEVIHNKIVQTSTFPTAEKETETSQQVTTADKEVDVHIESSEKSKSDTTSHKSRKKKRRRDKPESPGKSEETETGSSVATSIAESMEINIPSSDSSKHASEQPQPDVAEIMKPATESSLSFDDSVMMEDNGYRPDDKIMDESSVAREDEDGAKKKRKKKRKQKVCSTRDEDLTQLPKTSSDDAAFTDDSFSLEIPKLDRMAEEDKARDDKAAKEHDEIIETGTKGEDTMRREDKTKESEIEAGLEEESVVKRIEFDDANTQTTVETCDTSTVITPKADETSFSTFVQTSPEPLPLTLEEEIQTAGTEEAHIETQTIAERGLDFSTQTVVEEIPEVEDSGVQTTTPTLTPMEELAVQTSPIEDEPSVVTAETEDSQAQTVEINVLSTEMQTLPVEVAPMMATETQTAMNAMMEVEQQTTPPPAEEKVIVQETAIQTSSPEVVEFMEQDVQTSGPTSPKRLDVLHMDTQTIAVPEVLAETTETQTTPEESPRKSEVELQEAEMQTRSPEPTKETMMQTSPIVISPEPAEVCEESAQTSIEETKQTTEEESQTSCPEEIQTFYSSAQREEEESTLHIEESVQDIPEMCDISAQTSPREEEQPAETVSVSQQTARIATHTVEISTDDLKAEVSETVGADEAPLPAGEITLEETKAREEIVSTELSRIPAAPDVQVPETARSLEEMQKMEAADEKSISVSDISTSVGGTEALVEKETRDQLPETIAVADSPRSSEAEAKVKESAPSSISEKETTSDTSFEIHVQATIELSASDTLDSIASGSKETPDTSQDTTVAEDLNNDANVTEHDNKAAKRQRRKRKHKTMEIILPDKDKSELVSIFGQPVESQGSALRLSYCDVAKKNAGKERSPTGDNDISDDVASEYPSQMISQVELDLKPDAASGIATESMDRHEEDVQSAPDVSTTSKTALVADQFDVDVSHNISEGTTMPEARTPFTFTRPTIEPLLMPSDWQKSTEIAPARSSPEPMDTTEEPLTPVEIERPILSKETIQPFRTEIKTFAEVISESQKKAAPSSAEGYEQEQAHLWKETAVKSPSPHALSAAFLLKESLEYGLKPQHQATHTMQATRKITDRVKNLQNSNEFSHLGNILHIAHLEESITTDRLAEERSWDVRRELTQLKNAVQENDGVVVEETLVTVVETISTWLETIEYRVFLNKKCPTGPTHEDTKAFIELKDEMNHVEESIRELDDIWKQVEPNYPEEDRERLRECVDALEQQAKVVEHVTVDEERHANRQLAKWDEFLNSVNNMYR